MRIPIRIEEIGTGSTIDISASGVAFVIDVALELGRAIDFALRVEDSGAPLELRCGGKVIRVERRGPSLLTVATIDDIAVWRVNEHSKGKESAARPQAAASH